MMYLASYKAFNNPNATLLDKLIAIFTNGKYSHSELVFSNGNSISISPRDKKVRFKRIDFLSTHWDLIPLPFLQDKEFLIMKDSISYVGHTYDYVGAILSGFGVRVNTKSNKLYCSELVSNVLRKYCNLDKCSYSPSRLHKEVLKCSQHS